MEIEKRNSKKNVRPLEKCRLCQQEKLLCKSHIIMNAIYRKVEIHGEHNKFKYWNPTIGKLENRPNGIWEYLLCEECEKKLKVNEDLTLEVLYNHESPNGKQLYTSVNGGIYYPNYNAIAKVFGGNDFSYFRKFIL